MHSERYKFIYIDVPKTASASIRYALVKLTQGEASVLPEHNPLEWYKESGRLKASLDEYFIFTFVRNPWARIVSAYFYLERTHAADPSHPKHIKFADFCRKKTMKYQYNCLNYHTPSPLSQFDFVGRVENLQNDFDTLCDKLELERMKLGHRNAGSHGDWRKYYDDETRKIITQRYARDIEIFGYTFDD